VVKGYRKALGRIVVLTVVFVAVGAFVLWDHDRVSRDFSGLKVLLGNARYQAISNNEMLAVQFNGKKVVVEDRKTGKVVKVIDVPTLNQVNCDTTFGDDMMVFDGYCTYAYNKRLHSGDLRLKSWSGFQKNIAVNCTGLVTEGIYPRE
jgi:hypothetical protein